jgi:hypothetical protein
MARPPLSWRYLRPDEIAANSSGESPSDWPSVLPELGSEAIEALLIAHPIVVVE